MNGQMFLYYVETLKNMTYTFAHTTEIMIRKQWEDVVFTDSIAASICKPN